MGEEMKAREEGGLILLMKMCGKLRKVSFLEKIIYLFILKMLPIKISMCQTYYYNMMFYHVLKLSKKLQY